MNDHTLGAIAADPGLYDSRTAIDASRHRHQSGVSWAAIFAGAAGAAALSLILLILGTGLGLSSVSPWAAQGASATTFGVGTIVWITFTQLAASGMGGYLAGRLRTRWQGVHTDEVYFRDTAHGFLAWAVATLITAAVLTSAIGGIVGTGAQAGASVVGGAATTAAAAIPATAATAGKGMNADSGNGYFVDSLFRANTSAAGASASAASAADGSDTATAAATVPAAGSATAMPNGAAPSTAEVGRIFTSALASGSLPADDARYVAQLVSQRTGLSQADAQKRVTDTYARMQAKAQDAENAAREAADKTRKATAYGALWLFVSLLVGAFVASYAATFGGRRRDLF